MKSNLEIYVDLSRFGPQFAALDESGKKYRLLNERLAQNAKQSQLQTEELCHIAASNDFSGIREAARDVRFSLREQGLIALELSKLLASISSQFQSLSEGVHAAISDEPEAGP